MAGYMVKPKDQDTRKFLTVQVEKSVASMLVLWSSDLRWIAVNLGSIDEGEVVQPWEALVEFGFKSHINAWNIARGGFAERKIWFNPIYGQVVRGSP